ncbi:MAG: hypothetical protein RSD27_01720 [Ruthenibacterium sp.]
MDAIITGIGNFLSQLATVIATILPKSPFVYLDMIPEISSVLGYVNYFVPVSTCVTIAEGWLLAIGLYYLYSVALRWLKVVS